MHLEGHGCRPGSRVSELNRSCSSLTHRPDPVNQEQRQHSGHTPVICCCGHLRRLLYSQQLARTYHFTGYHEPGDNIHRHQLHLMCLQRCALCLPTIHERSLLHGHRHNKTRHSVHIYCCPIEVTVTGKHSRALTAKDQRTSSESFLKKQLGLTKGMLCTPSMKSTSQFLRFVPSASKKPERIGEDREAAFLLLLRRVFE